MTDDGRPNETDSTAGGEELPPSIHLSWDDDSDAYRVTYDASDWSASTVLVFAVANIWNTSVDGLPPLSSVVNPDSLDVILRADPDKPDEADRVSFEFASCRITATAGDIFIVPVGPGFTSGDGMASGDEDR